MKKLPHDSKCGSFSVIEKVKTILCIEVSYYIKSLFLASNASSSRNFGCAMEINA